MDKDDGIMKKIFFDFKEMALHPRRFAEKAAQNKNLAPLSTEFTIAFAFFILYSILSSIVLYLSPAESAAAITGAPVNIDSPLWKIITVSLCGALFTVSGSASLLCGIMPFISKGRLSLRLPLLLILVPAAYFIFFIMPGIPSAVRIVLLICAAAGVFVPAFKHKEKFMRLLRCFFAISAVFILFQLVLLIPLCRLSPHMFMFLYFAEGILSLIYFVNFCMAFSGLSAAKASAALITAMTIVYVIIWSAQFSSLIPPDAAQILMMS